MYVITGRLCPALLSVGNRGHVRFTRFALLSLLRRIRTRVVGLGGIGNLTPDFALRPRSGIALISVLAMTK